jgi:DNA-binding transcriptional ArsR family regulator
VADSSIDGKGLFAVMAIAVGETIFEPERGRTGVPQKKGRQLSPIRTISIAGSSPIGTTLGRRARRFDSRATCVGSSTLVIYNHMVVDYDLAEEEIDRIFGALADSTRRDILGRAIRHEQSVSALARQYAMSFAAVQKHVAVLERARLVTKERRGREQIVHANPLTLGQASMLLDSYEQQWIQRAERIAHILTNPKGQPT